MNTSPLGSTWSAARHATLLAAAAALLALWASDAVDLVTPAEATETCDALPGAQDYCASSPCGPCAEGQGDCDEGQCGPGLACVEEGTIDRCRRIDGACGAAPDSPEYCAASGCGPCGEGAGDCEPGECGPGLACMEEGVVDRCRPWSGASNLEVLIGGVWRGVCCDGSRPEVSSEPCWWTEGDRILTDETADREMDCDEGGPQPCACGGSAERLHGVGGGEAENSLARPDGGPLYPDYRMGTCVDVTDDGELETRRTDASCPSFRAR